MLHMGNDLLPMKSNSCDPMGSMGFVDWEGFDEVFIPFLSSRSSLTLVLPGCFMRSQPPYRHGETDAFLRRCVTAPPPEKTGPEAGQYFHVRLPIALQYINGLYNTRGIGKPQKNKRDQIRIVPL